MPFERPPTLGSAPRTRRTPPRRQLSELSSVTTDGKLSSAGSSCHFLAAATRVARANCRVFEHGFSTSIAIFASVGEEGHRSIKRSIRMMANRDRLRFFPVGAEAVRTSRNPPGRKPQCG
jgi:hypothetical protein